MPGTIHQINVSNGGVPKLPVDEADVIVGGVVGDHQNDAIHHGGPDQDLCLYSLEIIEALQAEGHPIEPGFAGENLTLAGITWDDLASGVRIQFGETAVAEVTSPAIPCSKNAAWFADRDFRRIHHDLHPDATRWYARVITPGRVRRGDTVSVLGPER
ncbi:MAG: MOSC domain-containing protein [Acidimicrobiia bacterium]